jgi:NADH-quinone oxidoreductase subunit J
MTSLEILFYFLAAAAVVSAVGVISAKNPIYSALYLVVTLFSLAGIFVLLSAGFLAVIQILTYAGAILVLFVFIIMLLNLQPEELEEKGYGAPGKVLLALVSLALFLGLGYVFSGPRWVPKVLPADFGTVAQLGRELFENYVVPFEIAGILLTVALVGAVVLAKRKLGEKPS